MALNTVMVCLCSHHTAAGFEFQLWLSEKKLLFMCLFLLQIVYIKVSVALQPTSTVFFLFFKQRNCYSTVVGQTCPRPFSGTI